MTPKERAARQALEALEEAYENGFLTGITGLKTIDIITALREVLDHSGEANEMVEFFSKEMKNKISVARAEQAEQEPVGYVDEALRIKWLIDYDAVSKLTGHKLYAAPVRTKDLTDDEIDAIEIITDRQFARAVIAADREKNK